MKKIDDDHVIVDFNEKIACNYEFSACVEWLLIACASCVDD